MAEPAILSMPKATANGSLAGTVGGVDAVNIVQIDPCGDAKIDTEVH